MDAVQRVGRNFRRPELTTLAEPERRRVIARARGRRLCCPGCGQHRFTVGDALYLGFLFHSAGQDDFMVALTCANPRCPSPRSAIKLLGRDFLDPDNPRSSNSAQRQITTPSG